MENKEELEQKLIKFQILQRNLQMLHEREDVIIQRLDELDRTDQTLDELTKGEALISLGSGNFVSGKILESEKVLVGVGGGVAIRKDKKEAKRILADRIAELQGMLKEISVQEQMLVAELQRIQPEIESLSK